MHTEGLPRALFCGLALAILAAACAGQPTVPQQSPSPSLSMTTATPTGTATAVPSVNFVFSGNGNTLPSIERILEAGVGPNDYIGIGVATAIPVLVQRLPPSHVIAFPAGAETGSPPPSESVQQAIKDACSPVTGVIVLDIEHWTYTPIDEQADPAGAILNAATQLGATAPVCGSTTNALLAGIAPDGQFVGISKCMFNQSSTGAFYNETAPTPWSPSDWNRLSFFVVQAQITASTNPNNSCSGSVNTWLSTYVALAKLARAGNPGIAIFGELSLNDEDPQTIIQAIESAQASAFPATAYLISYPNTGYDSTPADLETVLTAFGRPTPAPT